MQESVLCKIYTVKGNAGEIKDLQRVIKSGFNI